MDAVTAVAWAIVPLIAVAQFCSWYGMLTTNHLAHAVENSTWAVAFLVAAIALCRLLPEFEGLVRFGLVVSIGGIAAYLAFLITIDIPMYLSRWQEPCRWQQSSGSLEGLRDASTRWVVTHDFAQWKDEIAWMSLYFTVAVWESLALYLAYSLGDEVPHYRAEPAGHVLSFGRKDLTLNAAQEPSAMHRVLQAAHCQHSPLPILMLWMALPLARERQ